MCPASIQSGFLSPFVPLSFEKDNTCAFSPCIWTMMPPTARSEVAMIGGTMRSIARRTPQRLVPSLAHAGEGEDGGVPNNARAHHLHLAPIPAFPRRREKEQEGIARNCHSVGGWNLRVPRPFPPIHSSHCEKPTADESALPHCYPCPRTPVTYVPGLYKGDRAGFNRTQTGTALRKKNTP